MRDMRHAPRECERWYGVMCVAFAAKSLVFRIAKGSESGVEFGVLFIVWDGGAMSMVVGLGCMCVSGMLVGGVVFELGCGVGAVLGG